MSWSGVAMLIACAALWSLNGPLIKLLNDQGAGVHPLAIAAYRSLVAAIVFLPWALARRDTVRAAKPAWLAASVICFTVMTAAFVTANVLTAASTAIVLQYTAPIFVVLLSPLLLGERVSPREWPPLTLALLGVAVIYFYRPAGDSLGIWIALLSGLGFGCLTLTLRGLRQVDPRLVVVLNCGGSGLVLLAVAAYLGVHGVTQRQFLILALMGVVQFALPYVLYSLALQRVEAYRASLITLLEMILNPIWTWLAVGEQVPPATLAGGPLILAGVALWTVLMLRQGGRRQAAPEPPPARPPAQLAAQTPD